MSKKGVFLAFLPRHKSGFPKVLYSFGMVIITSGGLAMIIAGLITFIQMFIYGFSIEAAEVAEILAEVSVAAIFVGVCLLVLSYIIAGFKKSPTA